MASWRDGPEYAPRERPAAFVTPPVAPLETPGRAPSVTVDTIGPEPSFTAPTGEQPDLATLVPAAAPGRNPTVPFDVSTAAITAASGWSGPPAAAGPGAPASGRPPTQPFTVPGGPPLAGYLPVQPAVQPNAQVNPSRFPAPNTPQWFAPPPETRVPDAPPPVTIGQIWQGATPGVMIPLIVGLLFSWLSILMLAVSFALSARIPYRRDAIRRAYVVAFLLIGMGGALSLFENGYDSDYLFQALSSGAQAACLVLPIVVGLIVGAALRAGERPDRFG